MSSATYWRFYWDSADRTASSRNARCAHQDTGERSLPCAGRHSSHQTQQFTLAPLHGTSSAEFRVAVP